MTSDPTKPADAPQNIGVPGASDQPSPEALLASCGDFDMRIARDGTWYYRGSPITRKPLVKLFSTVLRRDHKGDYWLVTPVERARIAVDDTPFTAVEFEARGEGPDQVLRFRNNVDDWVEAGRENPIRVEENPETGEPSPYILVRDNLEARILRPVYYQLVDRAVEHRVDGVDYLGLWSKSAFFPLGKLP
jgi:hypothetical protein